MKFHYDLHIAHQMLEFGSAKYFHTYADETFNRKVKSWAARVHGSAFAFRVLSRKPLVRRLHGALD